MVLLDKSPLPCCYGCGMCNALLSRQPGSGSGSGAARARSEGKARQRAGTSAPGDRQTGEKRCDLAVIAGAGI